MSTETEKSTRVDSSLPPTTLDPAKSNKDSVHDGPTECLVQQHPSISIPNNISSIRFTGEWRRPRRRKHWRFFKIRHCTFHDTWCRQDSTVYCFWLPPCHREASNENCGPQVELFARLSSRSHLFFTFKWLRINRLRQIIKITTPSTASCSHRTVDRACLAPWLPMFRRR